MIKYKILYISAIVATIAGCAIPEVQEPIRPLLQRPGLSDIHIEVTGMAAVINSFGTPSQNMLMAKRAAIVDGYRQIGERVYGIKVNGKDTIKDMAAKSSTVNTCVSAIIKNAKTDSVICKDDICQANMSVDLDSLTLRELFPWKD